MTAYRFLVLLKPEANRPDVDKAGLRRLVDEHFERHAVEVLDCAEFRGSQLRSLSALDAIYPRLAVIARVGERALVDSERQHIAREVPGVVLSSVDEACIQFGCTGAELCAEGDHGKVFKLGPGAYASHIVARGRVVLNHFYAEFRDRFYNDEASVVAFECRTAAIGLHQLRDALVGHIHPDRAQAGSLRASALKQAVELRLGEVSVARNFFHISPGYIEAMYQLAHLFPGEGTLRDRLAASGASSSALRWSVSTDALSASKFFAEAEHLQLHAALKAMEQWTDEHYE